MVDEADCRSVSHWRKPLFGKAIIDAKSGHLVEESSIFQQLRQLMAARPVLLTTPTLPTRDARATGLRVGWNKTGQPSFFVRWLISRLFYKMPDFGIDNGFPKQRSFSVTNTPAISLVYHFRPSSNQKANFEEPTRALISRFASALFAGPRGQRHHSHRKWSMRLKPMVLDEIEAASLLLLTGFATSSEMQAEDPDRENLSNWSRSSMKRIFDCIAYCVSLLLHCQFSLPRASR